MQSLLGTKAVPVQDKETSPSDLSFPKLPQTSPSDLSPPKLPEEDIILKKAGLDRLRLLLVYLFSSERVRQDDVEELKNVLSVAYPDLQLKALNHVKPKSTLAVTPQEEAKDGISAIFSSNSQLKDDRCGDKWDRNSERLNGSR